MRNIEEFNQFGTTGIDGLMIVLSERMDDACEAAMKVWYDHDPRDTNAFASRDHSNQSEASYWTVGDNDFEFCVRIAAHTVVNCKSTVHLNINVMDFIAQGEDWIIDYEAACAAVDAAASTLLEKIA